MPKRLPKVLSVIEIEKILKNNLNVQELAIVELLYSAGLRVSELVNLKVKNINLNANQDTNIEVEFETKRRRIMEVRVNLQD